jgi:hypothetical protein
MPSVSGVVRSLGDCAWLDAARARAYARILLAVTLIGAVGWIALSSGGLDRQAKPIGTDFVGFYTASRLALDGRPNLAYNVGVHWAAQRALFDSKVGYTAFFYPPPALLVCLPLALAPYFVFARGLASGDWLRLLSRLARLFAVARPGCVPSLSGSVRERRSRPERVSQRGPHRRRSPRDEPETRARRRLFRRHGVQTALGVGDPVCADIRPPMDDTDRRSRYGGFILPGLAHRVRRVDLGRLLRRRVIRRRGASEQSCRQ